MLIDKRQALCKALLHDLKTIPRNPARGDIRFREPFFDASEDHGHRIWPGHTTRTAGVVVSTGIVHEQDVIQHELVDATTRDSSMRVTPVIFDLRDLDIISRTGTDVVARPQGEQPLQIGLSRHVTVLLTDPFLARVPATGRICCLEKH